MPSVPARPAHRPSWWTAFVLALVIGVAALSGISPAVASAQNERVAAPGSITTAVATPTPTLGSTESPAAQPAGAQDGDPNDWTGARWIPLFGVLALLVVGGIVLTGRLRVRRAAHSDHSNG